MPGHKGTGPLGCEARDITEVGGADVLSKASGIIAESERNAAALFGTRATLYSCEGSTLCIKTMLALAAERWRASRAENDASEAGYAAGQSDGTGKYAAARPTVVAARNVHKAFVHACALLDLDIEWIESEGPHHLCSVEITRKAVADAINRVIGATGAKPCCVYITTPDYLGHMTDVRAVADVAHGFYVPLLADNAHGSYLRFLKPAAPGGGSAGREIPASMHPADCGADMCCDSAHKTLPVLTGGAYLHISQDAPEDFARLARNTMAVFASTSPSYLVLQSLDLCNKYLAGNGADDIREHAAMTAALKRELAAMGYSLEGEEPLKITLNAEAFGLTGDELAEGLRRSGIEPEFSDEEFCVLMFSASVPAEIYGKTAVVLRDLRSARGNACESPDNTAARDAADTPAETKASETKTTETKARPLVSGLPPRRMTVREAVFGPREIIPVSAAVGRISAAPSVSCPPAVPITVSGEEITPEAVRLFRHYGIEEIDVVACRQTGPHRFSDIGTYLRGAFGKRMVKLPIDAGFTCPNRDGSRGTGGCAFCSDSGSGEFAAKLSAADIEAEKKLFAEKWPDAGYIAYFQSHTNTYAPVETLRECYGTALGCPGVEGLAVATRPDCLPDDVVGLLDDFNQKTFLWAELGLQTVHEKTARDMNRCCTLAEFDDAVERLSSRGIRTVVHLIFGLPGETRDMMLDSVRYVAAKKPFGIKLHLLNVVKGTALAGKYPGYTPFNSADEYVRLVCDALELIPPEVTIHRLTGDVPRDMLLAPEWSFEKRSILNAIDAEMERRGARQGDRAGC